MREIGVTGVQTCALPISTGLPAGIPVVAGGGDNACAAIGAGLIQEGPGVCSLGTSGTLVVDGTAARSEEGRVGKEGRSRWSRYQYKKHDTACEALAVYVG